MPHTLLLADDSVTIQRVIELTFADEDVHVVAVSDGDEAIAVLDKNPPDIVLADVGMPGRNGYEVAEHIKNTPRLAHIPIVLLTGAFEKIDEAKAEAAGCAGVLNKPFEPQIVIGRVKELLARPRPARTDSRISPPTARASSVPIAAPAVAAMGSSSDNRDYFDRLDQAFANLAAPPDNEQQSVADAIDWFATHHPSDKPESTVPPFAEPWDPSPPAAPPPDLPLSYARPPIPAPIEFRPEPVHEAVSSGSTEVRSMSSSPAPPPSLPPLADAFAALLAAEQSSPAPSAQPVWPGASVPAVTVTDDLIEQVTRRVLERLSDRVVKEAVGERVSAVAERLVREEIQKIKSAIK